MTKSQITLEEALELVDFIFDEEKGWQVEDVKSDVRRSVWGDVGGYVEGNVYYIKGFVDVVKGDVGIIRGNVDYVKGDVKGYVFGTIKDREWQFIETPKEKLERLIQADACKSEILDALNEMENN